MNLPFENPAGKSKKAQCFCCSEAFDSLQEMKDHIIENHDEGRDYVLCPRCSYPVRDLKLHWSVKHPHFALPAGIQYRAIIWRDIKGKKTRKPKFKQGDYVSKKNNGKVLHYRSGYELEIYKLLEEIPEVVAYDVESLEVRYYFENEFHTYWPDLSLLFADGHREIWEVKPQTQCKLPINIAKWKSAGLLCEARGWDFEIITEKEIGKLRAKVRKLKRGDDLEKLL